jgi:hypothetical protein
MFSSKWAQCRGNKGKKSVSQAKADLLKKTIEKIVLEDKEKKLMFLLSKKDEEKHATIIKIG